MELQTRQFHWEMPARGLQPVQPEKEVSSPSGLGNSSSPGTCCLSHRDAGRGQLTTKAAPVPSSPGLHRGMCRDICISLLQAESAASSPRAETGMNLVSAAF